MAPMNALTALWRRSPVVSYSVARIALFLVVFGAAVLLGLATVWALVVGLIVSMVASFFLLSRQRDAISANVVARAERSRQRMAERTAAEDAWDEANRSADGEREAE
jgi:uncharacterized membrane protein YphA (DoxX/SURF4 family)